MTAQATLTPRQQSVLVGLAQGWRVGQIASAIQASKATVYRDLTEIAERVGLKKPTSAGLVVKAWDLGVVSPNLRLTESGRIVITVGAASRG